MSKIKENSTHQANKNSLGEICTEVYAINLLSGQWTLAICCHLFEGRLRFGELKKRIPQITERMLTLQLRKMEEDGLVTRTVYPEVPPRVEYELTESAQELKNIFLQLQAWGDRHKARL